MWLVSRTVPQVAPTALSGLPGDYNDDGLIDTGDYVVWRKTMGENGIGLDADGSGNGTVGPEDYEVWSQGFADMDLAAAGSMGIVSVPEPAASVPIAVALILYISGARNADRRTWIFDTLRMMQQNEMSGGRSSC
jgi:hypothetical protein